MDELTEYFKSITLPTRILKINAKTEVINANLFIEACQRKHAKGDPEGELLLRQFKSAIETGGYVPRRKIR